MYEIIFDFSASPIGGPVLRLIEYIKFFNKYNNKVLFLVHPKVSDDIVKKSKCEIVRLKRNFLKRIFNDYSYVKKYKNTANVFFSYGIPIYRRMACINWIHLSNALPFAYKQCTLTFFSKMKNALLYKKFSKIEPTIEYISAESYSTFNLFFSTIELSAQKIILYNGFDKSKIKSFKINNGKNIALTVGSESYKRLDLAYNVYLNNKKRFNLEGLWIRGKKNQIPKKILKKSDVKVIGYLSKDELVNMYRDSKYFISMSEIENSANAVLEALYFRCTVILSKIPSHLEMFKDFYENDINNDYFIAKRNNLKKENSLSWDETIQYMCKIMKIKLDKIN